MAHKSGLDLQLVHDAIGSAAGGSWMFNDRGPRIIEAIEGSAADQVEVKSAVRIFVKDLEIVRNQARACDVESRLASAALALFQYGQEKLRLGGADDSLVVKVRSLQSLFYKKIAYSMFDKGQGFNLISVS